MVELQNFHLVSFRGIEFNKVLILMELQNNYISQLYKRIDLLSADFNVVIIWTSKGSSHILIYLCKIMPVVKDLAMPWKQYRFIIIVC